MNFFDIIRKALRKKAQEFTQQEMADQAGVTQAHIGRLLSGKSPVEKMQLGTLKKLFPKAEVDLSGGIPDELEYERKAIEKWFFDPQNRQERYALLEKIEQTKKNRESTESEYKTG